jgi:hypothetical protein
MSTGLLSQALRVAVIAVPAVLIVLFAGLVAAFALVMDRERREYALDFARVCIDLAAVLVNGSRDKIPVATQRTKPVQGTPGTLNQ